MSMSTMPIIRVEIERMQHTLLAAINEHMFQLDEQLKEAVKAAVTVEAVTKILQRECEKVVVEAVNRELQHYFLSGEGRAKISALITKTLSSLTVE